MKKQNQKQRDKQVIALTQIFTIILSLFAFSYILGDNLKFVSAEPESEGPGVCYSDFKCGSLGYNYYCKGGNCVQGSFYSESHSKNIGDSCTYDAECCALDQFDQFCICADKCVGISPGSQEESIYKTELYEEWNRRESLKSEKGGDTHPSSTAGVPTNWESYLSEGINSAPGSIDWEKYLSEGLTNIGPLSYDSLFDWENYLSQGTASSSFDWEKYLSEGLTNIGPLSYDSLFDWENYLAEGTSSTPLSDLNPSSMGAMTKLRLLEQQMGTDFTPEELAAIQKGITESKPTFGSMVTEALNKQLFPEAAGAAAGFLDVTVGSILKGAAWAAGAYVAGKKIGEMMGLSEYNSQWLGISAAIGFFAFQSGISGGIATWLADAGVTAALGLGSVTMGTLTAGVSIVIGAIIFAVTYREEKYEVYSITCSPWQAPLGGESCERCNEGDLPCTEYRCKSLGQACELENKGTKEEICVWASEGDIEYPTISPWEEILTEGYKYNPDNTISPPDKGVRIVSETDSSACVSASTPLKFGVSLNEPGRCKLDSERKDSFEEMSFFFGNSQTLKYNHVQEINLLDLQALRNENTSIYQNEELNLHVRCQDANGNSNTATFAFTFCMEPGPDTTAPQIKATSILNGMPVSQGKTEVNLKVYLNEPAECKWSTIDQPYEGMENQMDCDPVPESFTISSTHECRTVLNGLKDRENNTFYFKCKDHPELTDAERNTNLESYKFVLRGTEELVIKTIEPNELLIEDARDPVPVTLKVETAAGYNKGAAVCSFSKTGLEGSYIQFFNTGNYLHTQELALPQGDYTYYIQCIDLGGNAANGQISFSVAPDNAAPIVVRSYYEEKNLKIITNEEAECVYDVKDCTYPIESGIAFNTIEGKTHLIEWKPDLGTHYIKCKDRFGNQPAPNACSIVLRPIKIL